MVKETEYYDLLCVEVTATDEQIKKAYRKQALKYHPDRPTGDTEKFKELSTAFQILSDSNKREIYDKYGKEGNPPEKETVDASDFFDSVFGGGAFKTYLGDVNFFSGVPEDFGMDEPQQPTDVSENPTDQECTDVVNDNFAQGIDFNVASDQEIKNFVKAQKEMKKQKKREMEQQRREIQKKKDEDTKKQIEEMTSSLNTLIDDYFLYQRQNREEEYIKKIQKEANLLKVESFGLELIHLIGSLYVTKAENFIKANKTFGFSRVVTGFIDKKNMTKDAYGVLSSALDLQKASANQGLDLDNEYLTAEQQAEMEGELMPKILKTMWLVLKMESTMKVRKTCDNILKDSNLSKKERLERAKVLVLIGKIFKETTRTKEEQEESQMFEDMIMKNKLK